MINFHIFVLILKEILVVSGIISVNISDIYVNNIELATKVHSIFSKIHIFAELCFNIVILVSYHTYGVIIQIIKQITGIISKNLNQKVLYHMDIILNNRALTKITVV